MMENMLWYNQYQNLQKEKERCEAELIEFEEPKKQVQKVKSFFQALGADTSKNEWIYDKEKDLVSSEKCSEETVAYDKEIISIANVFENALQNPNDTNLMKLREMHQIEDYRFLTENVMLYIQITKMKKDFSLIEPAYKNIIRSFGSKPGEFLTNGGKEYHYLYLSSLGMCIEYYRNQKNEDDFEKVKAIVRERLMNYKLMLNGYISPDAVVYVDELTSLVKSAQMIEKSLTYET